MSKERLEEMEELLNEYYENIDDPFAITDIAMEIVGKMGYFVNRVNKLEDEVDRLNGVLHFKLSEENIKNECIRKLRQQNKRYREALEEIARGRFSGASYKARQALEGME